MTGVLSIPPTWTVHPPPPVPPVLSHRAAVLSERTGPPAPAWPPSCGAAAAAAAGGVADSGAAAAGSSGSLSGSTVDRCSWRRRYGPLGQRGAAVMVCSAITLSLATVAGVISVALLGIAFGTDNWVYIRVDRKQIQVSPRPLRMRIGVDGQRNVTGCLTEAEPGGRVSSSRHS